MLEGIQSLVLLEAVCVVAAAVVSASVELVVATGTTTTGVEELDVVALELS
jgi:hypothetical protein